MARRGESPAKSTSSGREESSSTEGVGKHTIQLIDRPEQSHCYRIMDCVYWQHPVYMLKDGDEYFVGNREEPELPDGLYFAGIEKFLQENNGAYFYFYSPWPHPLEMLNAIGSKYTFDSIHNLLCDSKEIGIKGGRFLDFHGNLREIAAGFYYRIYDESLMMAVRKAAAPIIQRNKI